MSKKKQPTKTFCTNRISHERRITMDLAELFRSVTLFSQKCDSLSSVTYKCFFLLNYAFFLAPAIYTPEKIWYLFLFMTKISSFFNFQINEMFPFIFVIFLWIWMEYLLHITRAPYRNRNPSAQNTRCTLISFRLFIFDVIFLHRLLFWKKGGGGTIFSSRWSQNTFFVSDFSNWKKE